MGNHDRLGGNHRRWADRASDGADRAARRPPDAGFAAIDLGNLVTGGAMQQIHHPLAGVNLIRL